MNHKKRNMEEIRRRNLFWSMGITEGVSLYAGLQLGYCYRLLPDDGSRTIFNAFSLAMEHMAEKPWQILPSDGLMVLICALAGAMGCVCLYNEYLKVKGTVEDAHGDAAFETDYRQYDREFVFDPDEALNGKNQNMDKFAPRNEEYKRVLRKWPDRPTAKRLRMLTQIYSKNVALSLNGRWTQRNTNAIVFGSSGAGKSRYFLLPNVLQANSSFVITDPSGDIMLKVGDFLTRKGYKIKCFSTSDMHHSCRFNPLHYIRDEEDIPVIVNALLENTSQNKRQSGGDGDFWVKSTQALLCCAIGYLYEIVPIEQRNFANVLEILRMDGRDEFSDPDEATDFDTLFVRLGEANPNSFAYNQYVTYKQAPSRTALNIMISTSVLLSQYLDIAAFKNLTYRDEMELDRIGEEKMAVFLNIPQADTTYSWITAMLFSILFKMLYRQGEERMRAEGLGDPELKVPVRCLIDECKNIGKIPKLDNYLSTCRKYRISIVPIFQSFSQVEELYGKGTANEILTNCSTKLFLGGSDAATLKIVCDEMGKETVKVLNYGSSKGRNGSISANVTQVGRELMSRIQVSQMSSRECLVFIQALRPFKDEKYRLENHPNYRYLPEGGQGKVYRDPFVIDYEDDAIEAVRIKAVGEEGYIEPPVVDSARRRALVEKNRKKVAELEADLDRLRDKLAEAIERKKGTERIEAAIINTVQMIRKLSRILPEKNGGAGKIASIRYIGDFSPDYEFERGSEENIEELLRKKSGES